jgi:hypothetical protein
MLTQLELKEKLHYDQDTGIFTWLINRTKNTKAGDKAGYLMPDGYVRISFNGIKYKSHRLAWLYIYGLWPKDMIDHINGNPSDNRIKNLREATGYENQHNTKKPKTNKSGVKGISFHKASGKWQCSIRNNGIKIHLGYFDKFLDAEKVIIEARTKYHNNFAKY